MVLTHCHFSPDCFTFALQLSHVFLDSPISSPQMAAWPSKSCLGPSWQLGNTSVWLNKMVYKPSEVFPQVVVNGLFVQCFLGSWDQKDFKPSTLQEGFSKGFWVKIFFLYQTVFF